jgi:hypothetical protein
MSQQSRPSAVLPTASETARARSLHDRARHTRWLADMTMDAQVRTGLHQYAAELDREADAADAPPSLDAKSAHRDAR